MCKIRVGSVISCICTKCLRLHSLRQTRSASSASSSCEYSWWKFVITLENRFTFPLYSLHHCELMQLMSVLSLSSVPALKAIEQEFWSGPSDALILFLLYCSSCCVIFPSRRFRDRYNPRNFILSSPLAVFCFFDFLVVPARMWPYWANRFSLSVVVFCFYLLLFAIRPPQGSYDLISVWEMVILTGAGGLTTTIASPWRIFPM